MRKLNNKVMKDCKEVKDSKKLENSNKKLKYSKKLKESRISNRIKIFADSKDKNDKKDKKEKQSMKKVISNNWFILKISFQSAPLYMFFLIFQSVKQRSMVFLEHTIGIKYVLESAEFNRPFINVLRFLIMILALWAILLAIDGVYGTRIKEKGQLKIKKRLKEMIYEKVKDLDLECYDNPEYYNEFVLSISEAEQSMYRAHQIVETFFSGITTLITSGIFLLYIDSYSMAFVFASFALTFIFSQLANKIYYKNRLDLNEPMRKRSYIHRVFYLHDYAKELRLNPEVSDRLYDEFDQANQEVDNVNKKYEKKRVLYHFIIRYLTNDFITDVLYITYLVYRAAVQHLISYSSAVVLFNSTGNIKWSLRNIADIFPKFSENSLYIQKVRNFLSYEKKIVSHKNLPIPKQPKVIELKNVSFQYNDKEGYILKNINLSIPATKKIALVGYNGAGKTTLIKLIMRLYDPTEGEILYDGVNIKDYEVAEYRNMIGTIFQDFKIFAASVAENVTLDYMELNAMEDKEKHVLSSLSFSGFKDRLTTLTSGLSTPLTTEFDENGLDLSGGESQKLAIARAFYKDAHMIILDEPSSALDPIAEYHLNETMLEAARHKSVIFISHRLSTTRNADRIYMLEHGQIIEQGTHRELIKQNGKYAGMWKVQAGQYVDAC